MAEIDRIGIPAMFSTDTHLKSTLRLPSLVDCHAHQLADTGLIKRLERIIRQDFLLQVCPL